MKIQWLGHSSFRILGSKTIVTDPYGEIGLRFPDVRADIVTVSHGHHDHNAVEAVKGEPAIVDDAGMHKIADLSIMGYNTAHDDEQGAKRGHNIVFVIQMDGTRVAHLGDIGCIPDHNVLGALQKVDVLLLPVGGNYTIDGEQAAELVKLIQPRTTIPMHYKTPGLTVAVSGAEDFLSRMGEGVERVSGSEIEITPMMPKVVVFEKPMGQE
ncbi:MAG TPA: MBL fold metallo-hydrolase [Candidatus Spyradocola merdavium]|nr:MBL fold metallo-hydrolase [Candidatus Spyradocola merdavium]